KEMVSVETDSQTFNADSLIVSAGAWSNKLLYQLGLELPLNPVRKTFAWFETNESLYNEKDFPAFTFETSDKQYYGFLSINYTLFLNLINPYIMRNTFLPLRLRRLISNTMVFQVSMVLV